MAALALLLALLVKVAEGRILAAGLLRVASGNVLQRRLAGGREVSEVLHHRTHRVALAVELLVVHQILLARAVLDGSLGAQALAALSRPQRAEGRLGLADAVTASLHALDVALGADQLARLRLAERARIIAVKVTILSSILLLHQTAALDLHTQLLRGLVA